MRKIYSLIVFALLLISSSGYAQKFGYVDSEYILGQMPEYRSAQKQLDALAEDWQGEIKKRMADIEKSFKNYQAEKVFLTEEMKKKREQEIVDMENSLKQYQEQKFGYQGELFKKRQELIKPIQDKVFDAVQRVAKANVLDFIFDKSSDMIMLYSNAKYDKSDEVLEELNIVPSDAGGKKK